MGVEPGEDRNELTTRRERSIVVGGDKEEEIYRA